MHNKFDFSGYATKVGLKCNDGRTILVGAFKEDDKKKVPLVWQHMHDGPNNVLGHAILEYRDDGMYVYGYFNDTPEGKNAKVLVHHGDIDSLSIWANDLIEKSKNVIHGVIREVSLVLSGANPGALIDYVSLTHSDGTVSNIDDEAVIYTGLNINMKKEEVIENNEEILHAESEETIGDVFNTLSDKQKMAVYSLIDAVLEEDSPKNNEEEIKQSGLGDNNKVMKHNVFDGTNGNEQVKTLTKEQFSTIVAEAQRSGSFRNAILKHAGTYGIDNIDYLFPDAQTLSREPSMVMRDMGWVRSVINGTRHSPFSRVKTVHADITADEARALGYITGSLKKEEVFGLLKRTTTPTTIYKKQKLDRDDIVDITDLDIVAWMKREMRVMLDEEIARAALFSDGRAAESEDKINETNIRPIWTDDALYSHKVQLASDTTTEELMESIVRERVEYKGSGSPSLYIGNTYLTDMLLLKDSTGRRIYPTMPELASALRVTNIVEIPLMDGLSREVAGPTTYNLAALLVNLYDYTIGADRGGEVNMFDDFDIDYNQYKYLLETRISGALTLPKSALVFEIEAA